MAVVDADRNLLFGLIALQNGLIVQDQLLGAFRAWTVDKGRALADYLADRGDLDAEQRAGVEAMVALHWKKHGGDGSHDWETSVISRRGPTRSGRRSPAPGAQDRSDAGPTMAAL